MENVEPLVDKHELKRPTRAVLGDVLFGRDTASEVRRKR
jgi:hypothetical protein